MNYPNQTAKVLRVPLPLEPRRRTILKVIMIIQLFILVASITLAAIGLDIAIRNFDHNDEYFDTHVLYLFGASSWLSPVTTVTVLSSVFVITLFYIVFVVRLFRNTSYMPSPFTLGLVLALRWGAVITTVLGFLLIDLIPNAIAFFIDIWLLYKVHSWTIQSYNNALQDDLELGRLSQVSLKHEVPVTIGVVPQTL